MSLFKKDKTKKEKAAPAATPAEIKALKPLLSDGRVLIRKPWTSEKAHSLHGKNQYVFIVNLHANKPEIKKAVAHRYNVVVRTVNIIRQQGKTKRLGRNLGRRSDFKKAIVTLAAGNKIEIA
ncbi:MAG: 50S ribosomal protein L23 [Candidatus Jorgensenbacteria bacterium GW2011_GWA1_48_11]|uniref:Large ribosomal subunit protein uL23 n=1 Tax=Candidatus Jorgensenbacteria bacterium GW2011_GWA1_48_11 TaxID=1618660 RepID=A0A0G1X980_9BACT|nr:MAG: 50S ribosomal protein L23 [Candidatus Jorgensenbacteria bacterium GW2011_GWA1_48_11]KKW12358.1 MAG: 50S ribosomal protein L23 [Candidatus Jorgensenbacteria bacterium GW2011_GWB1_49_9]